MLALALAGCAAGPPHDPDLPERLDRLRDALFADDLPRARAVAGAFAARLDAGSLQGTPLDEAAVALSRAPDLEAGGRALAALAGACGTCHAAAGVVGPEPRAGRGPHPDDALGLFDALVWPDRLPTAAAAVRSHAEAEDATPVDRRLERLSRGLAGEAGFADLVVGCVGCHARATPAALPQLGGASLPRLDSTMAAHYLDALGIAVRLAGNDLDGVRRVARSLLDAPAPPLPEVAARFDAAVRSGALRIADAPDRATAATALSELLVACANCHRASGGGPTDAPEPAARETGDLHVFGAYWMWYALLAPDERAWTVGAAALATSDDAGPAVRELGERALAAPPSERPARFAALFDTCASCHTPEGTP